MTPEQIKLIVEAYLKAANRPDGRASTISEYIRYILDGDIDLVTSKDCVILDEEKQLIHAIFVNEDMNAQASFPIKVLSTDFSIIQKIEGVFSQENFEKFLNEGFLADLLSEEKKKFIIEYTRARSNQMQAQQPREAEPFFKTNPTVIPMPHKRIEREEYVATKVKVKKADGTTASYGSMKEAILDLQDGAELTLTEDVALDTEDVAVFTSGATAKINLAGNTIKATNRKSATDPVFTINSGSLVIDGEGTIETDGIAFRVQSKEGVANLTLGAGITVKSNGGPCVFCRGEGTVVTTAADLITDSKDFGAIQGNGTDTGITVNIIGGTITCGNEVSAIYQPQNGILNISDATITGGNGIYIKAGELNISGATKIHAIGPHAVYEFNNNGTNETGDAITADFCGYPGGYPKVTITGGEFISDNGKAFESYTKDGVINPAEAKENVNISGGRFNTEILADYLAEGYTAKYNAVTKRYSVVSE